MEFANFHNYGKYSNNNYGLHCLCFTDPAGNDFYYSYQTLVAFRTIKSGLVIRKNVWSPTTGKHLNWISRDKKIRVSKEQFNKQYEETFLKGA